MGTFLKVWRSEWAGLSRAQLAIAMSAWMTNGKRVKPGVIQWWEEGQPPSSTEELEALLQVMRTHGLSFPEVNQFRTAVFAACLDRQYPGLSDDDASSHRKDIAHVVEEGFWPHRYSPIASWPIGVVHLVALMTEVERVSPACGARQAIARQQALSMMRETLSVVHARAGRVYLAVELHAHNRAALAACPEAQRPDLRLTTTYLEAAEAYGRAHAPIRSPRWAHRLLELADGAEAAGDLSLQAKALLGGLHTLAELCPPVFAYEGLRPKIERVLGAMRRTGTQPWSDRGGAGPGMSDSHYELFCALIQERRLEQAESQLGEFSCWEHDQESGQASIWQWSLGRLEYEQGRYGEAQHHFERGTALASGTPQPLMATHCSSWLSRCQDAQRSARRRHAKPLKRTQPKAK